MSQVIFYLNDMIIELLGLQDGVTLAYLNAATVTVTLVDCDTGTEVVGQSWPLTMPYVAASNGDYRATLISTLTLVVGDLYIAKISAVESGLNGYWELPLTVEKRKFT